MAGLFQQLVYGIKVNYNGRGFSKLNNDMKNATRSMYALRSVTGALGSQLALATGAIFGAVGVSQMLDTAKHLDKIRTRFVTITGSIEKANELMREAQVTAHKYGLELRQTEEGMSMFLGSTLGSEITLTKAREMYKQISAAVGGMRLSNEEANGALLAFSQIVSKGKIQAEELRRQLANRMPGAFRTAEEAIFGKGTKSLGKLDQALRDGKVGIKDLIKITEALYQKYGRFADKNNGIIANWNRMTQGIDNFKRSLLGTKWEGGFARLFGKIEKFLNDPKFLKKVGDFSDTMYQFAKAMIPILEAINAVIAFMVKNFRWILLFFIPTIGSKIKALLPIVRKFIPNLKDMLMYQVKLANMSGFIAKITLPNILRVLWAMTAPILMMYGKTLLWYYAFIALVNVVLRLWQYILLIRDEINGKDTTKYNLAFKGMVDSAKEIKQLWLDIKNIISGIINPSSIFTNPNILTSGINLGANALSLSGLPTIGLGNLGANVGGALGENIAYAVTQNIYTNNPEVPEREMDRALDGLNKNNTKRK